MKKLPYLYIFYHRHIDSNEAKYVKRLADTVAIKSVSAWPETRGEIKKMVDWTKAVGALIIYIYYFF